MQSRIARQLQRERFDRLRERSEGRLPNLLSFSFGRAAEINLADLSKLPVVANDDNDLQNAEGDYYFLVGYSSIDGPDIIP